MTGRLSHQRHSPSRRPYPSLVSARPRSTTRIKAQRHSLIVMRRSIGISSRSRSRSRNCSSRASRSISQVISPSRRATEIIGNCNPSILGWSSSAISNARSSSSTSSHSSSSTSSSTTSYSSCYDAVRWGGGELGGDDACSLSVGQHPCFYILTPPHIGCSLPPYSHYNLTIHTFIRSAASFRPSHYWPAPFALLTS